MIFKKDSKEEFDRKFQEFTDAIDMLEITRDNLKNATINPVILMRYKIEHLYSDLINKQREYIKQQNCDHKDIKVVEDDLETTEICEKCSAIISVHSY